MRLWCAKKALAKALGGAVPKSGEGLVIKRADTATGRVEVGLTRELAKQFAGNGPHRYSVYTLREKDWITATSILKGYALAPGARVA